MSALALLLAALAALAGCTFLQARVTPPEPPASQASITVPPAVPAPPPADAVSPTVPPSPAPPAGPSTATPAAPVPEAPAPSTPPAPAPLAPTPPTGPAAPTASPPAPPPSPPPQGTPAVPPTPPAPPPPGPLTLQMSPDKERQLRAETQKKLDEADRLLRQIEGRPLKPKDQETFLLARSFLDQARKALLAEELDRAANLATKARTLSGDLAAATK